MDETQELREVVVFFSYDNPTRPKRLAELMLAELQLPHLALGVDALTGACELRLYYHKETLTRVQTYLNQREILYDISYL